MTVKNTTKSPLHFGEVIIRPGLTATLPPEFSEEHPVVSKYLRKRWLKKSDSEPSSAESPEDIYNQKPVLEILSDELKSKLGELDVEIDEDDTALAVIEKLTSALEEEKNNSESPPVDSPKSISQMGKPELEAELKAMGVKIEAGDTKPILQEKLTMARESKKEEKDETPVA